MNKCECESIRRSCTLTEAELWKKNSVCACVRVPGVCHSDRILREWHAVFK